MNGNTLGGYAGSIKVEAFKSKPARIQGLEHKYTNVFVKNIPELMTKEKFDALFLPFGAIKQSKVCTNLDTGRSKEFGYVEFVSHDSATAAVAQLNNTKLDGEEKALQLERALTRSELQLRKTMAFTSQPQQHVENPTLYVKHFDDDVDDSKLRQMFEKFSGLVSCKVRMDENDRTRSKGFGFVTFGSEDEATKALLEMSGKFIGSKPLYVAKLENRNNRRNKLSQQYNDRRMHAGNQHFMLQQQYNPYGNMMMNPAMSMYQGNLFCIAVCMHIFVVN